MSTATTTAAWLSALHLGLGGELNVDGAPQELRGVVARVEAQVAPWLGVGLDGAWHPHAGLGIVDWADQPDLDALVAAWDVSPVHHRTQLTARLAPFRGETGGWRASLAFTLGAGLVHTRDDLDLLGWTEGDPYLGEHTSQWHLAPAVGLEEALGRGPLALHLAVEHLRWTEDLPGGEAWRRRPVLGRATLVVTPGAEK